MALFNVPYSPVIIQSKLNQLIDWTTSPLMSPKSQIELIPWDPESPDHLDRLVEQRVQCGWHEAKVNTSWRKEQREGTKCIYWIVSATYPAKHHQLTHLTLSGYLVSRSKAN